ncbi:MAG: ScpA family protein [Candidatus Hydrothermarchaeales archaeon]
MHPVDLLIDLVLSEEMDPWEIDIAGIANRFLEKVKEMSSINLRLSGKTLLAASILLRMKSDTLMPEEIESEDEFWDGYAYDQEEIVDADREAPSISVPARRRAERKATLFELIEALQRALSEEMIRKNFPREVRQRKLVIQVDEEGIKEKILKLYEKIKELAKLHEVIKFSELLPERSKSCIVEVIVSLLYLASDQRVKIWQKELFGEIFITLRN